ncbi:MAG: aldo/keto reductase [Saprospiraceae bacterium]|nr:aldo/keto reductase [Saprospiraceae bacterium]
MNVCTKVGGKDPLDSSIFGLSKESIVKSINNSLKRLNTEKVYLVYLHFPDFKTSLEDTLLGIKYILDNSLAEEWGISNFTVSEILYLYDALQKMDIKPPIYFQTLINLVDFNSIYEIVPIAINNKLKVLSWSPLCGGLLTNRASQYQQGKRFTYDTYWSKYNNNEILKKIYNNHYKNRSIDSLEKISLDFLHFRCNIDCIVGFESNKQLVEIHEQINEPPFTDFTFYEALINENMIYPYNLFSFMDISSYVRNK